MKIPVITGPTASGKSGIALDLALKINGEIISADSVQVYRRFDKGTSKPSQEMRSRVPHHLIDIRDPEEDFSAGDFYGESGKLIEAILGRKKVPVFCGGTGFYLWTLLHGISPVPKISQETRTRIRNEYREKGPEYALGELEKRDPFLYSNIDKKNPRRVMRALEVIEETGKPFSEWQKMARPLDYDFRVFVLSRERQDIFERITERTSGMLESGWIEEVRDLMKRYPEAKGLQSVGYKEIAGYLKGEIGEDELKKRIVQSTRQYARKQIIFWKREKSAVGIDLSKENNPAGKIEEYLTA